MARLSQIVKNNMEYKELVITSIQSLRRNLLRTALTMLGIIIGISSVILISSIGQSAVKFVTNEISSFGTNLFQINPGNDAFSGALGGSSDPLTIEDVEALKEANIPNVNLVAPLAFSNRTVESEEEKLTAFIYGFTPEMNEILNLELYSGENLSDSNLNENVAVLGSEIAEKLFGIGVDPVGESVRIDDTKYKVIGVSHSSAALSGSQFNNAVTIPLEVLQTDITGDKDLPEIDVTVHNPDNLNETIADVEQFLRDHRNIAEGDDSDFSITSIEETLTMVQTITGLLTALIAGISSISLLVGGVGVMNIMLVSVTERTKEIGLLKAIGAKEKDILTQFLIESVVMSVIGGLIGISIGVSLSLIVSFFAGLPIVVSIPWIIITVIVSTLVGIVFGLYPAKKAASLSPIDALRYE